MTLVRLTLALPLLVCACFEDIVPEDDDPIPTTSGPINGSPSRPMTSTGGVDSDESSSETTGETTAGDEADAYGGAGVRAPGEGCDDGNDQADDGCSPQCEKEPRACASNMSTLGEDIEAGIGVCKDSSDETCEQDFASLCAPGWHLCSGIEHVQLNDGVFIQLGDVAALGVIRCRSQGGSGHYTSHDFNVDGPDSCEVGSSRADCPTNLGCNEGMYAALCCAPIPSCGNGAVDDPREECDDGNDDDFDACSNACANRTGSGPHC